MSNREVLGVGISHLRVTFPHNLSAYLTCSPWRTFVNITKLEGDYVMNVEWGLSDCFWRGCVCLINSLDISKLIDLKSKNEVCFSFDFKNWCICISINVKDDVLRHDSYVIPTTWFQVFEFHDIAFLIAEAYIYCGNANNLYQSF